MSSTKPKRVHASGRLVFRRNVRQVQSALLPLHVAGDSALVWAEIVPDDANEVEIEIGSGKGSFMVEAARTRPLVFFVGIEAGPTYAAYCADRLLRQGLKNACMVVDDARLFLKDSVPQGRVRRLHIYYPDPWPKRRHRKRRIFDGEFPLLAHRILEPHGELLIATDNCRYFGEILAVCGASQELRRSSELEERYGIETGGLAFGPTNFSKKYREQGRSMYRAAYVRRQP